MKAQWTLFLVIATGAMLAAGLPTFAIQNDPPGRPSSPSPMDGATGVSLE